MSVVLVAVPAVLLLAAALAALLGSRRGEPAGRLSTAAAWVALALAVVLAVAVTAGDPVTARWGAGLGLLADRLGVVLLLLVTGVGAVMQTFARRYLRGDRRGAWLFASASLLTGATAALVTAATLVGLALAWTVAGVALCLLLATYPDLAPARLGTWRTARAFAVGDLALWAAVVTAVLVWGDLDLGTLGATAGERSGDGSALTAVALLLVLAALARSAQLPFVRWLPATLAAPTPVSALLHAGVVNAGGILLVRTSPVFAASPLATTLAFVAGAATLVYATVLMLTKADVKGALAHSTMAQMGFMIMTCGLGALGATVFHLVAHGMYKATLFLGSGSAVARLVRHRSAPPGDVRRMSVPALLVAVLAPAAALLAVAILREPDLGGRTGTTALLAFAWASAALLAWGWLGRHPGPAGWLVVLVASVTGATAYLALLEGVKAYLAPSLSGAGSATASPWLLAVLLAVLLGLTVLRLRPGSRVHRALYVLALTAGQVRDGSARSPRRSAAVRSTTAVVPREVRA